MRVGGNSGFGTSRQARCNTRGETGGCLPCEINFQFRQSLFHKGEPRETYEMFYRGEAALQKKEFNPE